MDGASGWHQTGTHHRAAEFQGCRFDLQFRLPVERAASGERTERRNEDRALHATLPGRAQQGDAAVDIDPVDFRPALRAKIIGAMHECIDLAPGQAPRIVADFVGHALGVCHGAAAKSQHVPPVRPKAARDGGANVSSRTRDGATHVQRLAACVAMRCALAITVSVMVVAGMLGKTDASSRCTPSRPVGWPRMSVSNLPGCARMGNVPPE